MSLADLSYTPRNVASRPKDRRYGAPVQQAVEKARQRAALGTPQTKPDNKHLASSAWAPLPGSTPVSLEHRTGCCWPVTDKAPHLFCNEKREPGKSYCAAHLDRYKSKGE